MSSHGCICVCHNRPWYPDARPSLFSDDKGVRVNRDMDERYMLAHQNLHQPPPERCQLQWNQPFGQLRHSRIPKQEQPSGSTQAADKKVAAACVQVIKLISQVIADFANGEISQATALFDTSITIEQYLEKSFFKTASLIAASCRSAAVFSDCDTPMKEAMFAYGKHLGLAFQVCLSLLSVLHCLSTEYIAVVKGTLLQSRGKQRRATAMAAWYLLTHCGCCVCPIPRRLHLLWECCSCVYTSVASMVMPQGGQRRVLRCTALVQQHHVAHSRPPPCSKHAAREHSE
jgi:hypothetical protein